MQRKDVGGPQVPVQDAQGVQVQQGSDGLLQQGQDTGQGQAALENKINQKTTLLHPTSPCMCHDSFKNGKEGDRITPVHVRAVQRPI